MLPSFKLCYTLHPTYSRTSPTSSQSNLQVNFFDSAGTILLDPQIMQSSIHESQVASPYSVHFQYMHGYASLLVYPMSFMHFNQNAITACFVPEIALFSHNIVLLG
mmetsp:Transcript_15171/g.21641  ORF Transcript_15171/g.21641 Transcript_15171/m.21641 type:complete len:106 (+) Transcript_15171:477-794(+)